MQKTFYLRVKNNYSYTVELGSDPYGNITRIDNQLDKLTDFLDYHKNKLNTLRKQFEIAKDESNKPFLQEQELKDAMQRLKEVDNALKIDEKVGEIIDDNEEDLDYKMGKKDYER